MSILTKQWLGLLSLVVALVALGLILLQNWLHNPAVALYIHKIAPVGSASSLTLDASKRTILVTEAGNGPRFCSEPVPDAVGTLATEIAAKVSANDSRTGLEVGGNGAFDVDVLKLFERSQGIQALRDGMYRLCEAYLNEAVPQNVYRNHMSDLIMTLNFVMPLEICVKLLRDLGADHVTEASWTFLSDCAKRSMDVTSLMGSVSAARAKSDAEIMKAEAVLQATSALEQRPAADGGGEHQTTTPAP